MPHGRFCVFSMAVTKKWATTIATVALIGTPAFATDMVVKGRLVRGGLNFWFY
jgi:hypothetical protein